MAAFKGTLPNGQGPKREAASHHPGNPRQPANVGGSATDTRVRSKPDPSCDEDATAREADGRAVARYGQQSHKPRAQPAQHGHSEHSPGLWHLTPESSKQRPPTWAVSKVGLGVTRQTTSLPWGQQRGATPSIGASEGGVGTESLEGGRGGVPGERDDLA